MERFFMVAGSVVRITGEDGEMFMDPSILGPFETPNRHYDRQIHCQLVDTLSPVDGKLIFQDPGRAVFLQNEGILTYIGAVAQSLDSAYIRVERRGRESFAQMRRGTFRGIITAKAVLNALEAEHIVVDNDGCLLHASCICRNGEAVLFTAPSGIGKSTQAALWEQYRNAEIINGDRVMVRCTNQGCEVIGIPFSGSSGICKNRTMPLRAIVYLEQAEQTVIRRLIGLKAFRRIWEGCSVHTWNRLDVDHCVKTVCSVIEKVPVFHMSCTPDQSAVLALEAALTE